MSDLPAHVLEVQRDLSRFPDDPRREVGAKLIVGSPDLVSMWRSLERRSADRGDALWVWDFLEVVRYASDLPPFHYMPAKERRTLASSIGSLAEQLAQLLEDNQLDVQLVHNDGKIFNGFFFYEDFSRTNQASFDNDCANKLKCSVLIRAVAERAKRTIKEEPIHGKAGSNARALRFVRLIAARNERMFGEPLNAVVATAANALFGTCYQESDIRNLRNR